MIKKSILIALVALAIGAALGALAVFGLPLLASIGGSGNIKSSAALTASPASLAWGDVTQGTTKDIVITFTNTGDTETGEMTISNTAMPDGVTLTWNYTAGSIPPAGILAIQFHLVASETADTGAFTHTVTVT